MAKRIKQVHYTTEQTNKVPQRVLCNTKNFFAWTRTESSSQLRNMLTSFAFDLDPIITQNLPYTLEQAVETTINWLYQNE